MKILYAVQATGNGHITRARLMAKAFKALDIKVDWLFSGRPKDAFFDMEIFGDYQCYRGLTFVIKNGRISNIATLLKNNIFRFVVDVTRIDFNDYDLIINDFEPVTAWAAKLKKIRTVGISHQMSFQHKVPVAGRNLVAEAVLKNFAPVSQAIGLHWSDFNQCLLPPIIDNHNGQADKKMTDILVYFPFCEERALINWFAPFTNYRFHIFHGAETPSGYSHIQFHRFSRKHFQDKQKACCGIITGAGFELPSEAIQMGHKLLLIPLAGQMEQQSNALALEQLNRASVVHHFSKEQLATWLTQPLPNPAPYPNVALELAKWLVSHKNESLESLSKRLWAEVYDSDNKKLIPQKTAC